MRRCRFSHLSSISRPHSFSCPSCVCAQKSCVCMQSPTLCIRLHAFQLSPPVESCADVHTAPHPPQTVFISFIPLNLSFLFVSHFQNRDPHIYKHQTFRFRIQCSAFYVPILHFKPRNSPLLQAAQ